MSIDSIIPVIVEGTIISNGPKIIYESKDHSNYALLPRRFEEIIKRIDGKRTIKEIIIKLNEEGCNIPFKDVFLCFDSLSKEHLLRNCSEISIRQDDSRDIYNKQSALISRSFFDITILKRVILNSENLSIFVLLTLGIIIFGAYGVYALSGLQYFNRFLRIEDSYTLGLIFFLLSCSLLISVKSILKTVLLLVATGRVRDVRLTLNILGLSLRVDDSSIFTVKNRWQGLFYCVATIFSYYAVVLLISFFITKQIYVDQLFIIATLLTMLDLDPFRKSDTTKIFNLFYEEENMGHLLPYLRKKALLAVTSKGNTSLKEILRIIYSALAIVWLFLAFKFSLELLDKTYPNLISSISTVTGHEKVASLIVILALTMMWLYLLSDIVRLIISNIFDPFRASIIKIIHGKPSGASYDKGKLQEVISNISIFKGLTKEFVEELANVGSTVLFKKNRRIIHQGDLGEALYILLEGSLSVEVEHSSGATTHVANLVPGTIFGESALVNDLPRSADVVVNDRAIVFTLNRLELDILKEHSGFEKVLNNIKLNQYISSSEIFRNLPKEVTNLFTEKGNYKHFSKDSLVFSQNDEANGFYLLLRGEVSVLIDQIEKSKIKQGGFFGEMGLMFNAPRNATIRANGDIDTLLISSETFWDVLFGNINLAIFVESVADFRKQINMGRA